MDSPEFRSVCHYRLCRLKEPVSESFTSSVADSGLSFMFSRTACYQTQTAKLLYFLCIIKSRDISHLCNDSGQNRFTYSGYLQNVFCIGYLTTFFYECTLDCCKFCIQFLPDMSSPKSLIFQAFSLNINLKQAAKSAEQSSYHVLNS